jgi:DNA-binding transcriptional LysR family regulator
LYFVNDHIHIMNIAMRVESLINLDLLRVVEAIERLGSLGAAADELHLSQPAVSHALGRIRNIVGEGLFVRHARGMSATPEGERLARSARRIQAFVRQELGAGESFAPATLKRLFTFCMSDVGEMVFLPRLLDRIRRDAPGVDIRSVSLSPRRLEERLEEGSVDLAIGYFPDLSAAGIDTQPLFDRDFLCLVSRSHPRISPSRWSLERFLSEPHLVVSPEGRVEELFERSLRESKLSRRVLLSVPHTFAMPAIVSSSDLIATVSRSVGSAFEKYPNLRTLPLPIPGPRIRIALHWSARFAQDPAIMWIRGLIQQIFEENTVRGNARIKRR